MNVLELFVREYGSVDDRDLVVRYRLSRIDGEDREVLLASNQPLPL